MSRCSSGSFGLPYHCEKLLNGVLGKFRQASSTRLLPKEVFVQATLGQSNMKQVNCLAIWVRKSTETGTRQTKKDVAKYYADNSKTPWLALDFWGVWVDWGSVFLVVGWYPHRWLLRGNKIGQAISKFVLDCEASTIFVLDESLNSPSRLGWAETVFWRAKKACPTKCGW